MNHLNDLSKRAYAKSDEQTIVQEIADQLGMAVDRTGEWLYSVLPSYVQAKAWTLGYVTVVALVAAVVLAVAAIITYRALMRTVRAERKAWEALEHRSMDGYPGPGDHFVYCFVIPALAIFAAITLVVAISFGAMLVPWVVNPEGAVLMDVMGRLR